MTSAAPTNFQRFTFSGIQHLLHYFGVSKLTFETEKIKRAENTFSLSPPFLLVCLSIGYLFLPEKRMNRNGFQFETDSKTMLSGCQAYFPTSLKQYFKNNYHPVSGNNADLPAF
jgi:hypothetical protein